MPWNRQDPDASTPNVRPLTAAERRRLAELADGTAAAKLAEAAAADVTDELPDPPGGGRRS